MLIKSIIEIIIFDLHSIYNDDKIAFVSLIFEHQYLDIER